MTTSNDIKEVLRGIRDDAFAVLDDSFYSDPERDLAAMVDRLANVTLDLATEVEGLKRELDEKEVEIDNLKDQLSRHESRTGPIEEMVYGPK